ncbi:hypothetical protein [Streptomyces sp. NPDC058335]|uniref:hypothetical protein n=1 Tax=Streptomyces sp. NPDC058335 TaxID=3346451 RepID=UPI0036694872
MSAPPPAAVPGEAPTPGRAPRGGGVVAPRRAAALPPGPAADPSPVPPAAPLQGSAGAVVTGPPTLPPVTVTADTGGGVYFAPLDESARQRWRAGAA